MEIIKHEFSNRSLSFYWQDPLHETKVDIQLPNIEELPFEFGGDWGPMYTFKLKNSDPIRITYNEKESYATGQSELPIESPALAKERNVYPFYVSVSDSQKGLNYKLYVDQKCQLKKIEFIAKKTM